jgi:hypothetical protein
LENKIKEYVSKVKVSKETSDDLYEALVKHDLYPDDEALALLSYAFVNINNSSGKVMEHVAEFSKVI